MKAVGWVASLGIGLGLVAGCASPGSEAGSASADRSGLKYKDKGPVCMCSTGLSEADIKASRPQAADEEP